MAEKIKVTLLKPLDGAEIGSEGAFYEADVKRLEAKHAVKRITAKKTAEPAKKPRSSDEK